MEEDIHFIFGLGVKGMYAWPEMRTKQNIFRLLVELK